MRNFAPFLSTFFPLCFLEVVNGLVSRKVENEGEFAVVAFCPVGWAGILFGLLLMQPAS